MLSPPATMNFKTSQLRLRRYGLQKADKSLPETTTSSDLMILSKMLNIQTTAQYAKLGMEEFLGQYSPTSELPRCNRGHFGPRQHPVSLVGNHIHRLRQLHLINVGALRRSQPQPCHKQLFQLL